MNQTQIISGLPIHLQQYVEVQVYEAYSHQDHALWRFLMGRLVTSLAETAHAVYLEGVARVGIDQERIPDLEVMNQKLERVGWRVLGVSGFLPPAIFMEFQSRCILPVALSMRTIDQVFYTPAPDILHEVAGHAPFLIDVDYAEFLQQFGKLGMKAISSQEDTALFHATRKLSDLMSGGSAPGSSDEAVKHELQQALLAQQNAVAAQRESLPSEAAKLARLHWWTIEYGLVGALDDYRLFGAALLSSLGESVHCLDDARVSKKLLTLDAINQSYDITQEQHQLFVTYSCKHMRQLLDEIARGMCQFNGRADSVRSAINSHTICTLQYCSGLQVSGVVSDVITDAMDNPVYIRTSGPTELSRDDNLLPGHGLDYHSSGFGSPVGKVNEMTRCLSEYSIDELDALGIQIGSEAANAIVLEFVSGIVVNGILIGIERRDQKNILFSFKDCTVRTREGVLLFEPGWGQFDMAIGHELVSVFGGAADRSNHAAGYSDLPSTLPTLSTLPPNNELYQQVREVRDAVTIDPSYWCPEYDEVVKKVLETKDWLLLLEIYKSTFNSNSPLSATVSDELARLLASDHELKMLVDQALDSFNRKRRIIPA
jgi:phenylalanine-4-hydroxylase